MKSHLLLVYCFLLVNLLWIELADCSENASSLDDPTTTLLTPHDFMSSLERLQSLSRDLIDRLLKEALPVVIRSGAGQNIGPDCRASLVKLIFSTRNFEGWALQMLDSMGKIPLGLLRGTRASLGDYDECLAIAVGNGGSEGQPTDSRNFVGQYCAVDIRPLPIADSNQMKLETLVRTLSATRHSQPNPDPIRIANRISLRIGICVPSTCTTQDIREIANDGLYFVEYMHAILGITRAIDFPDNVSSNVLMNVSVNWCEVYKPNLTLETRHFLAGAYMFPIMFLVVLATAIDGIPRLICSFRPNQKKDKSFEISSRGNVQKIITAFSAYQNGKTIMKTDVSDHAISALHGIRFLSMSWIMLGNTYSFGHYLQISGVFTARDFKKDFFFQVLLGAPYAVESFFFISGLLVVYTSLRRVDASSGKLELLKFYLHRIIRISPSLMMMTAIMITGPVIGSGPVWKDTIDPFLNNCRERWWTNLLFISYLWKQKDICLPVGWFLSVDMLFYAVSPIYIILLFRRPKLGLILIGLTVLASMAIVAIITFFYHLPPVPIFSSSTYRIDDYINIILFKPYTHVSPYCIGMAVGYVLNKYKKIPFSPLVRILGWLTSSLSGLLLIYGIYGWNLGRLPHISESVIYAFLSRSVWSIALAWLVISCANGQGGAINKLLSWKAFVPLSHLTFMAYLMHPLIMHGFMANLRSTLPFGHFIFVWLFFAHLLTSYGASFLMSVVCELPFVQLERTFICKSFSAEASGQPSLDQPPSFEEVARNENLSSNEENRSSVEDCTLPPRANAKNSPSPIINNNSYIQHL